MKKRKAVAKKPATKKKPGALKKLAAKAMKLVKPKSAAKPAAKVAPKPALKVAKPAPKPVPARTGAAKPQARAERGPFRPGAGGSPLSDADVRRMPESAYMNDGQLEFFRARLLQMRAEVVDREVDVKERLHQRESFADPADRATAEEEHWLDLRLRERESLLLRKIDDALRRIRDREYGFCEVTGEAIGIPRLLARPTATVCVDVKGQNEQIESQFRDR
ncbi:MAG TPA: RNA polymerase-binding protein DksA [Verrucomicrobiae bacterium]|nr:RNA polymerase-binding protein DksA [Verrucomicrobiae bacterium]